MNHATLAPLRNPCTRWGILCLMAITHPLLAEQIFLLESNPGQTNLLFLSTYTVNPGTNIKSGPYEQWWLKDDWHLLAGSNLTIEEVAEYDLLAAIKETGSYRNDKRDGDRYVYAYAGHTAGTRYYAASFDPSGYSDERWSDGELIAFDRKDWDPVSQELLWHGTGRASGDTFLRTNYSLFDGMGEDYSSFTESKEYRDGRRWWRRRVTHKPTGTMVEDSYHYHVPGVTTSSNSAPYEKLWYTNGQLRSSREYNDINQPHGVHETYKENGLPSSYTTYRNGLRHGLTITYRSNGSVWQMNEYQNGVKHGPASTWLSDGKIESHGSYANGQECGSWTYYRYDSGGNLLSVATNEKGPCETLLTTEEEDTFDPREEPENIRIITGLFRSREDGMPIANVTLSSDRGPATTTGSNGEFSLNLGQSIHHLITASHPDYYSVSASVDVSQSQKRIFNGTMRRKLATDNPIITAVTSSGGNVFFEGLSGQNTFTISIDWQTATPKELLIQRNGQSTQLPATAANTTVSYSMDLDFRAGIAENSNSLSFQAVDALGFRSNVETLHPRIIPIPTWLQSLGQMTEGAGTGNIRRYTLSASWPQHPLELQLSPDTMGSLGWQAWSLVPLVGGENFGLRATQAVMEGELKTDGTGGLFFGGQTGFVAAGQSIGGKIGGRGFFDTPANRGLTWTKGSLLLSLEGQIEKEVGPVELIPALANAVNWPVVGGALRWFNATATFKGTITSGFDMELGLTAQEALRFGHSLGAIHAGIALDLDSEPNKNLKLGFGGGGEIKAVFHVPADTETIQSVSADIHARLTVGVFMFTGDFSASHTFEYPGSGGRMAAEPMVWSHFSGFQPVDTRFARSQAYFAIAPTHDLSPASQTPTGTIAQDVGLFAAPVGTSNAFGNHVAAVFVDAALPALQGAEIHLLSFTDSGHVQSLSVTEDTHADFEPTIASSGLNTLLAWSRVKDPHFPEDGDLLAMAAAMEIAFQKAYGSSLSGERVLLSDNTWLDHSPRLVSAPTGAPFLFWQSNQGNLLIGNAQFPTEVHFVDTAGDVSPAAVQTVPYAFVNCPDLRFALDGQRQPVIAFEHDADGDPATSSDRRLLILRKQANHWLQPVHVAAAGSDFTAFNLIQTTGTLALVWANDAGLHIHPIDNPDAYQVLPLPDGVPVTTLDAFDTAAAGYRLIATQAVNTPSGSQLFLYAYHPASDSWRGPLALPFPDENVQSVTFSASASYPITLTYLSIPTENSLASPDLRYHTMAFESRLSPVTDSLSSEYEADRDAWVITGSVRNDGLEIAENPTVRIYKQALPRDSITPLTSVALQPLVSGASQSFRLELPADDPANYGKLKIAVAPAHVTQLDFIPLYGQADLQRFHVPWDINVLATQLEQLSSTRASLIASLRNEGPHNATQLNVAMLIDGKEWQRRSLNGVYPGKQYDVGFDFSPLDDLWHPVAWIEVRVDPDSRTLDGNPLNDSKALRMAHPGLWGQAAIDAGAANVPSFGKFAVDANGIGYQPDCSWIYPVGRSWDDVYFYDYQRKAWWWSSRQIYPWRYYPAEQIWRKL